MAPRTLRVGVIGAGEVAQQIWLPTLSLLTQLYAVTYLCDISRQAVDFCRDRFNIPSGTTSVDELITSPAVDLVFVLTSDEHHEAYAVASLAAGKSVMVEKPMALSVQSAQRIVEAERQAPNNARVFVGYMRRYAHSFVSAFKREVASIPKILYARVRDFPGPNSGFVRQSGITALRPTDFPSAGSGAAVQRDTRLKVLLEEALAPHPIDDERTTLCRFLGSLGSHDLSLMREALGFPDSVSAVSTHHPFYSAMFEYHDANNNPYAVSYETGLDSLLRFDAHIAVYGETKTVTITYDTPYIKALPITVKVDEINDNGEATTREVLSSYEDSYTALAKELWSCMVEGKAIKTTAKDAVYDLKLMKMIFERYERQRKEERGG